MKFASLRCEDPDGRLLLVSRDATRALDASLVAPNLITALQRWDQVAPTLQALSDRLNAGSYPATFTFDPDACGAPLARSYQWCDTSAFLHHGRLMAQAFATPPIADVDTVPVMAQGAADDFFGPRDNVPLADESLGIDFGGEFGVLLGAVPMGVAADVAQRSIRLLVQLNDWSLRSLGAREMTRGFGLLQAKPGTSFAPLAITPDELGDDWRDGRVQLRLQVTLNDKPFGRPHGGAMHFSFGQLIAHAARTRKLSAGTVIGSGTVSNPAREAGSACIAERRALETIERGAPLTPFMRFGDRVRMAAADAHGATPFGAIEQRVVQPPG